MLLSIPGLVLLLIGGVKSSHTGVSATVDAMKVGIDYTMVFVTFNTIAIGADGTMLLLKIHMAVLTDFTIVIATHDISCC